jgi:hypothetical protein
MAGRYSRSSAPTSLPEATFMNVLGRPDVGDATRTPATPAT